MAQAVLIIKTYHLVMFLSNVQLMLFNNYYVMLLQFEPLLLLLLLLLNGTKLSFLLSVENARLHPVFVSLHARPYT